MADCRCGSKKKDGAVDFLDTNDIGAICAVFGAEGSLCRLLDLIPDIISKVIRLNPNFSNTGDVLGSLLRKVAKTAFNLILDENTGKIPVAQFCGSEPPAEPEQITYYDVYQFIAQIVPILSHFFAVNDILRGEQTKLLDKVVATWLRQKWFENCECTDCPDPPSVNIVASKRFALCPPGSRPEDDAVQNSFAYIVNARPGQPVQYGNGLTYSGGERIGYFWAIARNGTFGEMTNPISGSKHRFSNVGFYGGNDPMIPVARNPDEYSYNTFNGVRILDPDAPLPYNIPVCKPISPPPPPPPEFCDLFPQDPLCIIQGCTDPSALNFNPLANFDDGSCKYSGGGCTDPVALNYNPLARFNDGSCIYATFGCKDPAALNYNPAVTYDDGSCIYPCPSNSCRIECPEDPRGFCCIETAPLMRLHSLIMR